MPGSIYYCPVSRNLSLGYMLCHSIRFTALPPGHNGWLARVGIRTSSSNGRVFCPLGYAGLHTWLAYTWDSREQYSFVVWTPEKFNKIERGDRFARDIQVQEAGRARAFAGYWALEVKDITLQSDGMIGLFDYQDELFLQSKPNKQSSRQI